MNTSRFHIYIASCVPNGGIYHYICNNGTMQLQQKTEADQPMYLAVAENRVYAVLRQPFAQSEDSGVCWWERDKEGNLINPSPIYSTYGRCGCHLAVAKEKMYVANYLSGSLTLLPEGKVVQHSGKGPHPDRQEAAHVHYVGMTPDGAYLLAVDLGLDRIFLYTPDLVLQDSVSVPAGHGCRHLAWSEDGKYVFCANELASTVSVLRYDLGTLTLLDTVSAIPAGCTQDNTAAAIRTDGNRVYVSNRGCDNIAVFTHTDGKLSADAFVDVEGTCPRDFYIHGGYLFCTNETSDNVSVFQCRDGEVQSLHTHLQMPKPLCVIAVPEI